MAQKKKLGTDTVLHNSTQFQWLNHLQGYAETHIDAKTEHQTQKSKYIYDLTDKEVTET